MRKPMWFLTVFSLLSCFTLAVHPLAGSDHPSKKTRRVFTNDDLQKYRDKYPSDESAASPVATPEAVTEADPQPSGDQREAGKENPGKSYWIEKLRTAQAAVEKAEQHEAKVVMKLAKYQQKNLEAQTPFERQTTEHQVADMEKNLGYARDDKKKAEKGREELLEQAAKAGFKPEDLLKELSERGASPPRQPTEAKE
ncbi:MAG: hypothetical protein AB1898_03785 [Acidobacteriota bacterium]